MKKLYPLLLFILASNICFAGPENFTYVCKFCYEKNNKIVKEKYEFKDEKKLLKHVCGKHKKIKYEDDLIKDFYCVDDGDDRSFQCCKCSKDYKDQANIMRHIKHKHLGVCYKCNFCSNVYSVRRNFSRHLFLGDCKGLNVGELLEKKKKTKYKKLRSVKNEPDEKIKPSSSPISLKKNWRRRSRRIIQRKKEEASKRQSPRKENKSQKKKKQFEVAGKMFDEEVYEAALMLVFLKDRFFLR